MLIKDTKQKIRIKLKSFNHKSLLEACNKITKIINTIELDTAVVGPIPLPTEKRIYCVLRSPHVDKDSREHFEIRTHKRILDIYYKSSKTIIDSLSSIILPSGVLYKINFLSE
jgi:small subunit ribosomal protein S10